MLTFWGDRWVSRTSASILRAAGHGDFVRNSSEDYVAQAIALANADDIAARLHELRGSMRDRLRASAVCDTFNFARNMERIYRDIL